MSAPDTVAPPPDARHPAYRRALPTLSGEVFGGGRTGVDPDVVKEIAGQIAAAVTDSVQVAIVVGGGNFFRGAELQQKGMDRARADYMGMLGTVKMCIRDRQSLTHINDAYEFVRETVAHGGSILFVGTKKQAQEPVAEQAARVGMPYVNHRWLGGMLTNFTTISKRLQRLKAVSYTHLDVYKRQGVARRRRPARRAAAGRARGSRVAPGLSLIHI